MFEDAEWLLRLQELQWSAAWRIFLAAVLGAILGLERELRDRPAGLRTNTVIAIASCLFTILSIEGFPLKGAAQDTGRIAAQIVSGVGFLGAGSLLYSKNKVRGLTTAATIWLVAAVGMAVGAGAYFLAVFTALLSAAVLAFLRPVRETIHSQATRESRRSAKRDKND